MKMKKILKLTAILALASTLSACGGKGNSNNSSIDESPSIVSESEEEIVYKFEEEQIYSKIWESKVIYNEPCVMIEDDDGVKSASLLYTPTRIISVRNYTLQKEYDKSEYRVEGNKIYMTEKSTMPYLTQKNISCEEIPPVIGGSYDDGKGGNILFTEGFGIVYHQIEVTYEHNDTWDGAIPQKQGRNLVNTYNKLKNKEDINIVVNGDSIFTGANASSALAIEPFLDKFPDAFASEITRRYGSPTHLTNTSKGGEKSDFGKANVETAVNYYNPDLVVIGYGMNDGSWNIPASDYVDNIEFMIKSIQNNCPNADIIVCATILANPASSQNKGQADYLLPLKSMVEQYSNTALLDMTTFSKDLLRHKTSFELYANNINHPCDYMVRNYAVNLLNLLEVK